jgi:hypothetical protein
VSAAQPNSGYRLPKTSAIASRASLKSSHTLRHRLKSSTILRIFFNHVAVLASLSVEFADADIWNLSVINENGIEYSTSVSVTLQQCTLMLRSTKPYSTLKSASSGLMAFVNICVKFANDRGSGCK